MNRAPVITRWYRMTGKAPVIDPNIFMQCRG